MVRPVPFPEQIDDNTLKIKNVSISSNNLNITYSGSPVSNCNDDCITAAWKPDTIKTGHSIIGYACAEPCGYWGITPDSSSTKMLNGLSEMINPWVTTLKSDNSCGTSLNKPDNMTKYLSGIKGCIEKDGWGGQTYISIGGWAQGYTFQQRLTKEFGDNIANPKKGPIKEVIGCFSSTDTVCSDHPSGKILPKLSDGSNNNWGYWCFTKYGIQKNSTGLSQGGIACDGGTLTQNPSSCWDAIDNNLISQFISYAKSNNYDGIDIDYEPGGDVGNQPFNGYYLYEISYSANKNNNLNIVHAPLNNFFFDNPNWTCVNYSNLTGNINKKTELTSDGYKCEENGGYGHILFSLHQQHIYLNNIFIQFYNNPPGPCDATTTTNYCVTSGTIGAIKSENGKAEEGNYYTIGNNPHIESESTGNNVSNACSGGAGFIEGSNNTYLLQCTYENEEKEWAYKNAGYTYAGEEHPNMSGQYVGDPLGVYVKDNNKWLATTREEDKLWLVPSYYDNGSNPTNGFNIGGIKNVISIMLLAKSYQPNAPISFGTVPPRGGNSNNLSTNMIKDIFRYLTGLQKTIDNDVKNNTQSPILNYLMMNLYNNGRLRVEGMNESYWKLNWGGSPGTSSFCSKYPNYSTTMKESDKLFGGVGAWSIYWTELAKESNNNNWLDGLKEVFSIEGLNEDELKGQECKYSTGGGGGNTGTCNTQCAPSECTWPGQCTSECSGYYTKSTNSNGVCYKDKIAGSGMECCTGE